VDNTKNRWEEFLDPDVLRGRLISASIYIAAFEMLRESIIGRIETFFSEGFDENGPIISAEYREKVLSRNLSPLYASLAWLRENNVIDDADLSEFETLKKCRNNLAHELAGVIAGSVSIAYLEQLPRVAEMLRKIETWWIVNVEIPINPDFEDAEIDEAGILPGPVLSLQMMVQVALGSPEESTRLLNEFRKRWSQNEEKKS
jgi:hypothetical protein